MGISEWLVITTLNVALLLMSSVARPVAMKHAEWLSSARQTARLFMAFLCSAKSHKLSHKLSHKGRGFLLARPFLSWCSELSFIAPAPGSSKAKKKQKLQTRWSLPRLLKEL